MLNHGLLTFYIERGHNPKENGDGEKKPPGGGDEKRKKKKPSGRKPYSFCGYTGHSFKECFRRREGALIVADALLVSLPITTL